jgi:hypothetical protein
VSVAELAKIADASDRTVKRAIAWAKAAGLLEQLSRGRRRGDGTTSASAWRLLGTPGPQEDSSAPQRANPEPQGANSPPQGATRPNTPTTPPPGKRSRSRGTYTPPQAQEILGRHWCVGCGFALDPHLAAAGIKVHPHCSDPLDQPEGAP